MLWNSVLAAGATITTAYLLLLGLIAWSKMAGPVGSEGAPARLRSCCLGTILGGLLLSAGYSVPIHAWSGYAELWQFALLGVWTGFLVACTGYLALLDVSLRFETRPFRSGLWLTLILLGPWGPFYYVGRHLYIATRPRTWYPPAHIPPLEETEECELSQSARSGA